MHSAIRLTRARLAAGISTASLFAIALLAAMLLPAPIAVAQSADTAGLEVYVRDASGAALVDAKVHIVQQQQKITRDGVTNKSGEYRFTEIPVGDYTLTVDKEGFAKVIESGITLAISQIATINVPMKIASANEQVRVSSEVPIIDTDRSAIGQTISNIEIENLPSSSRDFLDFALTVPGVTLNTATGQGSGISGNGGRQRSNTILIDSVENNGAINGSVRQTISLDAISQFQVITNQFMPEYGQASGVVINLLTKSGTEQYHGSAFFYERNQAMDALPICFIPLASGGCPNPIFIRNDGGGTLGGPLYKDKTFFFSSVEYTGINTDIFNNIPSSFVPIANAVLARGGVVGSNVASIAGGAIYQSSAQTLTSFRVDHTFNEKNMLTMRFLYAHYINANPTSDRDDGTYSDYSNYCADHEQDYAFMAHYTHIFTPDVLDEFHFQYAPQRLIQKANSVGPTIHIDGYTAEFGPPPGEPPDILDETHFEWINALSWSKDNHLFKFGADISYIPTYLSNPLNIAGYFEFSGIGTLAEAQTGAGCPATPTVSNFACGQPYYFVQAFGNPFIHLTDTLIGLYAQDQWKVTPRLTLNYGIRYDLDLQPQGYNLNLSDPIQAPLPKGVPRDYKNFVPRIGFSYALNKAGTTVVRGGYGLFYDKIALILARVSLTPIQTFIVDASPVLGATGIASTTATYPELAQIYAAGAYPQTYNYPSAIAGISQAPSIAGMPSKMPYPLSEQADLFVDQALGNSWSFELGYVYVAGEHLLRDDNTNLPPPTIETNTALAFQTVGRPVYSNSRINPAFRDITEIGGFGHSTYNALRASLVHRVSRTLTLRANYIWAKAIDDGSDFLNGTTPEDYYNPHSEKSISTQDQRNRFVGSAVYSFPYSTNRSGNSPVRWVFGNWTASTITVVNSGTPENLETGSDSNNDDDFNDRPYVNGLNGLNGGQIVSRNAMRGARAENVQISLKKSIPLLRNTRIELRGEIYNLFNHTNYTSVNTIWGTAAAPIGTGDTAVPQPLIWGHKETTTDNFGAFASAAVPGVSINAPRMVQLGIRFTF